MKLLITAGPTREPIDAVRFISNRSSGRTGIAIARAAAESGYDVRMLLGPIPVIESINDICRIERFNTAGELEQLLVEHFTWCDVLIMAAAVADYRCVQITGGKMTRRAEDDAMLTLRLEPTPDLVAAVAAGKRPEQRVVAFALEQADRLEIRARAKLRHKNVDAIIANPLETMDSEFIQPLWLTAAGERTVAERMAKDQFAYWLLARIGELA